MQHDGHILEEHDNAQNPEDERHRSQDIILGGLCCEDVWEDIQRGCACA